MFTTHLYTVNTDRTTSLDDGTLNLFSNEYADSVDWLEDAKKIQNPGENLALVRNNKVIAIDKSKPLEAGDTIFLRLAQLKQGTVYRFTFNGSNINRPDLAAILQDTYLGTSTPLSLTDETSVDFNVTSDATSQGSARFRIIFQNTDPLPVTYTNIKAWPHNNDINIQWTVTNEINIKEYIIEKSTDGHSFADVTTVKATGINTYNWIDAKATERDNYYRIRCIGNNGTIQHSKIVKAELGNLASSIVVYSNPANDGIIGLQFSNMPKGIYTFRLFSTVGQQLFTSTITLNGGNLSQQLRTIDDIAKGVYQLEITKPDQSKMTVSVIIQ